MTGERAPLATEEEIEVLGRRSPWQRLMDRLFGYDFFISYRWSDGAEYAVSLAGALKGKGYVCFLDARDFKPGGNWAAMDRQALRRTSRLILVATADAVTDPRGRGGAEDPIVHELEAFRASGRHKVRIQFPGFDPAAWRSSPLSRYFDDKELYLQETADARAPSPAILAELERLCGLETEDRRRIRRLKLVVASLSLLLVAAAAATGAALVMRARAAEKEALAEQKAALAQAKKEEAERNADNERVAREQAEDAARRARAQVRITAVREAANDPTTQLVLLREVDQPSREHRWYPMVADILPNAVADRVLEIELDNDIFLSPRVSFSPDGTRVLAVAADGPLIWRIDGSGAPLRLRGHTDTVTSASFSPDGAHVVTASEDGTARIWRADGSGDPVILPELYGPLVGFASPPSDGSYISAGTRPQSLIVRSAAFSPDGTRVVTASEDGTARVWRVDGSDEFVVLPHADRVRSAAFSRDGSRIVTTSDDRKARVWRADGSGDPLVFEHEEKVNSASFSRDGSRIVTTSDDGWTRVWRADSPGEPLHKLGAGDWWNHRPDDASFSPDGTRIVNSYGEVWDLDHPDKPVIVSGAVGANSVSFSPETFIGPLSVLFTAWDGAQVARADGAGEPLVLRGPDHVFNSAAFSPDGSRVVTDSEAYRTFAGSRDGTTGRGFTAAGRGTLWVWRVGAVGESLILRGGPDPITACSRDCVLVLTASPDGTATIRRADGTGEPVVLRGHGSEVTSASFSPDGTHVVTVSTDETARVWRVDGSGVPLVLRDEDARARSASFSPDGTQVVAMFSGLEVRRLDGSRPPFIVPAPIRRLRTYAFSPDSSRVAAVALDTVSVHRVDGVGPPILLRGHGARINSASFSPGDGSRIVTASLDKTARVWRADGSGELFTLRHDQGVGSAAFSPDGAWILTTSRSTAWVWRADGSGAPVMLDGHERDIDAAAFSPDSSRVVTSSMAEGKTRVWRTDGSGEPLVLHGHSAFFSSDGARIFTTSTGGTVHIWPLDPDALLPLLWRATPYCLPVAQRIARLAESDEDAAARFERCEQTVAAYAAEGAYR